MFFVHDDNQSIDRSIDRPTDQAIARGRNCRVAFLVVRELVILAQAAVRGWIERRIAAKQRKARVGELRAQV